MTTSQAMRPASSAARKVRARRVGFRFDDHEVARHYVGGDIALSHMTSVMSAGFPAGEDAFIRSVRLFKDELTDPVLKEQVAGFIGQEMTHGREHRNLNRRLQMPIVLTLAMSASLGTDPAARNRVRVARSLARLPRSAVFRHSLGRTLRYLRPGFHPDDIKTNALMEKWRDKLFGAESA